MYKRLLTLFLFLSLGLSSIRGQNTSVFPTGLATDVDLTLAKDRAQSTLNGGINASVTSLTVLSGAAFPSAGAFILTIDNEQIRVCSRSSNTLTVCSGGRGFAGTTAASHSNGAAVRMNIVAWHHNQQSAEIKTLEAQAADNRAYNFDRTVGTFLTGDLSSAGAKTVTFSGTCPYGVAGSDSNHKLRISGGTGTAENVQITGGTCTSGLVGGGTLTFTTVNAHTGSWHLTSATGGFQEAHNVLPSSGGLILVADGTTIVYDTSTFTKQTSLVGRGASSLISGPANKTLFKFLISSSPKRSLVQDVWITGDGSTTIAVQIGDNSVTVDGVDVIHCRFQDLLTAVTIDKATRPKVLNNIFDTVTNGIITTSNTANGIFADNTFVSVTTKYTLGASGFVRDTGGMTFSSLPSNLANGSQIYLSDGAQTSSSNNACTSGGTGAFLVRLNSVSRCFNNQDNSGGGGGASVFADLEDCVVTTPADVITLSPGCQAQVGSNQALTTVGADATMTPTAGDGTVYIAVSPEGVFSALHNVTGTCDTGLTCVPATTSVPMGYRLLASVEVTSGTPGTITHARSAYSWTPLEAGTNITITESGGKLEISAPVGGVSTGVTLTADLPVIGAGGSAVAIGTRSGNTTQYVTTTGTQTSGDCVKIDANGNHVANGSACGGGGSDFALLEQHTASSSATLDFTTAISSTYDTYQIELINVLPATDGATINIRMSTDGGSTYDSGGNYSYTDFRFDSGSAGAGGTTGASSIVLAETNGVGSSAAFGLVGMIQLYNPGSSSLHKAVSGNIAFRTAAGLRVGHVVTGAYESNTAVNAIRFLASSGNIASGTIRIYGIAK